LQDPGLAIHPPMLYMGYVGFSVAFAFAVAALIGGKLDATWARWSRPWTTVAWSFLTVGIGLGSWWAYNELGWGGWWFWDPVENASFMPWLVGTALIHSLASTEKRGVFKSWTVLLAILAFSLSLLGTFIVRSGVLVSVHAFATDPTRGVFILVFLSIVVGSSLALYAWRAETVSTTGRFDWFSRETALVLNNVILLTAAVAVFVGTLYPLVLDALHLGKISVGRPYFDSMFSLVSVPLLILLGIGPFVRWKGDDPARVAKQLRFILLFALVFGAVTPFVFFGDLPITTGLGTAAGIWVALSTLYGLYLRWRGGMRMPSSFMGMTLAHLGIAFFVIGVTYTMTYSKEKDLRLAPGSSYTMSGYEFKFLGTEKVQGPNYVANQGKLELRKNGDLIGTLTPQKRAYIGQGGNTMTEAAINDGMFRDLYAAMGESLGGGAWSFRLYYKPMIRWIWIGCLMMGFGGLLAVSDKRYRQRIKQSLPTSANTSTSTVSHQA